MNIAHIPTRLLTASVLALLVLSSAVLAFGQAGNAAADHIQKTNANARASCMGHEASAVSPPSDEGDHTSSMPEELAFWDVLIGLGLFQNRGEVARFVATTKVIPSPGEDPHAACDAFFGLHDDE